MSELNLYEDTHGDGCGCPADQSRLSDLRKVRPGSLILDDATVADLVAALQEEGGEVGEAVGVTFNDMPEGFDGLIVALPSRRWVAPIGRYLVVRIDGET